MFALHAVSAGVLHAACPIEWLIPRHVGFALGEKNFNGALLPSIMRPPAKVFHWGVHYPRIAVPILVGRYLKPEIPPIFMAQLGNQELSASAPGLFHDHRPLRALADLHATASFLGVAKGLGPQVDVYLKSTQCGIIIFRLRFFPPKYQPGFINPPLTVVFK